MAKTRGTGLLMVSSDIDSENETEFNRVPTGKTAMSVLIARTDSILTCSDPARSNPPTSVS
jgi:hypothetical protein